MLGTSDAWSMSLLSRHPAWHFWFSEDEFSWEHFRVYLRTILQILERLQASRKSLKLFKKIPKKCPKLISYLGNKMSSLNHNVRRDHATMQQDVLLLFYVQNEAKIWRNYSETITYLSYKLNISKNHDSGRNCKLENSAYYNHIHYFIDRSTSHFSSINLDSISWGVVPVVFK